LETKIAIKAFSALGQSTRLEALQLLARHEPEGLPAGEFARSLNVTPSNLSTHLTVLSRAGLVTSKRDGRWIHYRASLEAVRALTLFLIRDCCQDKREVCQPLLDDLKALCSNSSRKRR
jgi:ArsR family transcriptional regulator, arsenate/arsenite/antimonite-responsive transcriptional repressor